jgi:hypothetical protein
MKDFYIVFFNLLKENTKKIYNKEKLTNFTDKNLNFLTHKICNSEEDFLKLKFDFNLPDTLIMNDLDYKNQKPHFPLFFGLKQEFSLHGEKYKKKYEKYEYKLNTYKTI